MAKVPNYRPERRTYTRNDDSAVRTVKGAADAITQLQSDLASEAGHRTDTIDHMVKLFTGQHNLGVPQDKQYVNFEAKTSKPADIIFRVMGMLTAAAKYEYVAPAGGSRKKAEDRQDSIEAHLNALDPWFFRKYGRRYDYEARFWQLLAGQSYIQQTYAPYHWDKTMLRRKDGEEDEEYNERVDGYTGYQGPPIKRESIDPRMIWPIMTSQGITGWVKKYRVQRYELDDAFRKRGRMVHWDSKRGIPTGVSSMRGMTDELRKTPGMAYPETADVPMDTAVDYYEYLDDTMCYYVAGDAVIDTYTHKGGIKIFPAWGLQTGLPEPHLRSVGILWPVRNEIPQYDFMRTLWAQKAYLDVFPQLFAILAENETPLEGENGMPQAWDLEPGTVKQIRGQLVNALKEASSGVDFRAFIEMLAGDIDLATISGLARGIAGAQQPGYSINQLSQGMRTMWKTTIESGELQFSSMAEHYLFCVKHVVKRDVSLFAVTEDEDGRRRGEYLPLAPDGIEDWAHVVCTMEPELPIDKQGTMLTWGKLYDEGKATWEEFVREGKGKTNPISQRRQILKEQFEKAATPKVLEDAMALGRVRLGNEILKAQGLDRLNTTFSADLQELKAARATTPQAAPGGAPAAMMAAMGQGGGMPQQQGPMPPPQAAGQGGGGIAPTAGANPADSSPGPRQGDMGSGMGVR